VPTDNPEGIEHARPRLARVAKRIGLRIPEDAEYVVSWSNDAWLCGDFVVRVCFRGDRTRMTREAALGRSLPPEVLYPRVLDAGADDDLAWMVVARVQGEALWERWKAMPHAQLRPIARAFADVLRALHAWTPPDDVLAQLRAHDFDAGPVARDITGHDLLPLPAPRWEPLVDHAVTMPFVDPGVVRACAARLHELRAHDPFVGACSSVVHGDANFANALEHDGQLTALLDYEWARLGPPDAELVSFVRAAGYWRGEPRAERPPVIAWLRDDYPELFAAPGLRERVWVTELTYILRQLVVWPMDRPAAEQPDEHPVHTLPRLIAAPWDYDGD
jgi:aminoglycoside phosphotransferase (APT) family kinase protein